MRSKAWASFVDRNKGFLGYLVLLFVLGFLLNRVVFLENAYEETSWLLSVTETQLEYERADHEADILRLAELMEELGKKATTIQVTPDSCARAIRQLIHMWYVYGDRLYFVMSAYSSGDAFELEHAIMVAEDTFYEEAPLAFEEAWASASDCIY